MTWPEKLGSRWKESDRAVLAVESLRVGLGLIWALNLVFVLDPANAWFDPSSFANIAANFGPSTVGGPGFANFVATNPVFFSWAIAILTVYLALAFILGLTTRFACFVGATMAVVFLWTQWGMIWMMPGGTDVGAHPVYLVLYVGLFVGGAGRHLSLDVRVRRALQRRFLESRRRVAVRARLTFADDGSEPGGPRHELASRSR